MSALETAQKYIRRRWNPVPIPFGTKAPEDDEWQNRVIDEASAPRFFDGAPLNVGIVLGPTSNGLTDVDHDCLEAVRLAPYLLPETKSVFGRASNPSSHWLYMTELGQSADKAALQFRDPTTRSMLVELRIGGAKGAQTVFPGSTHEETGEPIEWEKDGEPPKVDGDELKRRVACLAAGCLLVRYWPSEGGRHDMGLALGGFLARAGWSPVDIERFVGAVAQVANDPEVKDRQRAAKDAAEAYKAGKKAYGLPALREALGERVADRIAEWIGYRAEAQEEQLRDEPIFDPWEDVIVPKFPLEILPGAIQRYVIEQSRVIGCDPSALAMAVLANFSGSLDHRFSLKLMRNGDWYASIRLWVLLVGDPSRKKTPIIKGAVSELKAHQNRVFADYSKRLAEYKEALEGWDRKSGGSKPVEPNKPVRFVASDTTVEMLCELLSRGARGILIERDELAGWIAQMEKYGGKGGAGADRGVWLQSFDGGPYNVDRIGRGEIHVPNLSVSLIGGIQPQRLAELHGLTSDGLLQRFLPVMMGAATLPLDAPASQSAEDYRKLTRRLIALPYAGFSLADDALPVMNDLRHHIHDLEQVAGGLANGFQGFLGKLSGYAGSLALILHLAHDPEEARTRQVSRGTAENVRRLVVDFILPHAFEFYRTAETVTDGDRLQQIASWIVTSKKSRVRSRELTHNVRCLRGVSVKDVNLRVSPLVAGGWLTPEKPTPDNGVWDVSPAVQQQFEERGRLEEARKSAVARLMNSPRQSKW